jgi:NADH-quinone oxidoreductase subunit K
MVPTNYYVILSAILFGLGVFAFIFKRNVITIFMSIELMLNARRWANWMGRYSCCS